MTNPITPEAVERFDCHGWDVRRGQMLRADHGDWVRASDYDALARELAEVKAELDGLTKEQDDKSPPGLIVAQFITIEELQQNIRNLVKERDEWRDEWSAEADRCIAANASLRAARAQIVAAQDTPTERQLKDACMSYDHSYGIMGADQRADLEWSAKEWWRCIVRALPLTDPADALAEHDRAVRADERAKCAEVASAETGWDGVPYMSQMQYGPGIGKRIAAAILARGEQEGRYEATQAEQAQAGSSRPPQGRKGQNTETMGQCHRVPGDGHRDGNGRAANVRKTPPWPTLN